MNILLVFGILLLVAFWVAVIAFFLVLPIYLFLQVRSLQRRVQVLEEQQRLAPAASIQQRDAEAQVDHAEEPEPLVPEVVAAEPIAIESAAVLEAEPLPRPRRERPALSAVEIERWLGGRGLAWIAALLLLFSTAFFLKYAFDNDWIGPTGQIAAGVAGGLALCMGGYRQHRQRRPLLAQPLTAAGVILLYLCTFASFGYFELIPQSWGFFFLLVLVSQTALLALVMDAWPIALMAVVGGLLTPLLMRSPSDQYVALFGYLLILDAAVVCLAQLRRWPAIASVAVLGTLLIFDGWWRQYYHPEKMWAALALQLGVLFLFVGQILLSRLRAPRDLPRTELLNLEELARLLLVALMVGIHLHWLLEYNFAPWQGTLAICQATLYAALAWLVLSWRSDDSPLLGTLLAISLGWIAAAIPLQADTLWIAVGWAVQGLALWAFGLRIRSQYLRAAGVILLTLGAGRWLFIDMPTIGNRGLFIPLFNPYGLPALVVVGCILGAAWLSRQMLRERTGPNRHLQVVLALAGVLLLWILLSNEVSWAVYASFYSSRLAAQTAVSATWAGYALLLLLLGLRLHSEPFRWTALALFGLTLLKVVLADTAELPGLYRIVVFFTLSILLGVAAWGYQTLLKHSARPEVEVKEHA